MRRLSFCVIPLVLVASALATPNSANAVVVWNEPTDGDLSGDRLVPTSLALSAGTSTIAGAMAFNDKEYFTVNIPVNNQLSAITLSGWDGDDFLGFIAVQSGTQMTVPPETASAAGLLGWFHVGDFALTTDILPQIGAGSFGATGFTPPLPSGAYTFWLQQLDGLLVTYQFDYVVTAATVSVPGDYNQNGTVDAADYAIWRKTSGQTVPVGTGADGSGPGGTPDGLINTVDYNFWRSKFGNPPGAGAAVGAVIPEPPTSLLIVAATLTIAFCQGGSARRKSLSD